MADFRHDPMESREGKGLARRAWDAYAASVNRVAWPVVEPVAKKMAAGMAVDLAGFWLAWHLFGGFEGLERLGMNRATIYRKVSRFRRYYGEHPDVFQMPGVTVDPAAYWSGSGRRRAR